MPRNRPFYAKGKWEYYQNPPIRVKPRAGRAKVSATPLSQIFAREEMATLLKVA